MRKNRYITIFMLATLWLLCSYHISYGQQDAADAYEDVGQQSLTNWPEHMEKTETFEVEQEFQYRGKTYQVGRLLLKDFKYGALTLRVIEGENMTEICAPMDEYPDLEMSETDLIHLRNRPFFFVKDRYRVYLVDLEHERISARIEPGAGVEYGDDSISGTVSGFQFFDHDQYLLGVAVSYGPFCFNISDLDHPKELPRYTSQYGDSGQPYFFLEQQPDGRWNGLIAQSDTVNKPLYKEIKGVRFLFRDAHMTPPGEPYLNPVIERAPKPVVLLYGKGINGKKTPWVVDLTKGELVVNQAH